MREFDELINFDVYYLGEGGSFRTELGGEFFSIRGRNVILLASWRFFKGVDCYELYVPHLVKLFKRL